MTLFSPEFEANFSGTFILAAQVGGVIYGIYFCVVKAFPKRFYNWVVGKIREVKPKMPEDLDKDIALDDILSELRVEARADRAHIFQFHNGDHYDNKAPIRRFSATHEKLKVGVKSACDIYQGKLVSGFLDGLRLILESDKPVSKVSFDELPNGLYKTYMTKTGAHLHVGVPLTGMVKGVPRIVGFILITYNDPTPKTQCTFCALHQEGGLVNSDTSTWEPRVCEGTCPDCRLGMYRTRVEAALPSKGN